MEESNLVLHATLSSVISDCPVAKVFSKHIMNETQWAKTVQEMVSQFFAQKHPHLQILQGANLSYANEVLEYRGNERIIGKPIVYETDLLVVESTDSGSWKPRVVIECKIHNVSTHDAITYSEKAFAHKRVHPYLRYGILIGNRKHYPLPGRLFRHGLFFDFMASWVGFNSTEVERIDLLGILVDEVQSSRHLEGMLYESRSASRKRYVVLHKPLILKESMNPPDENDESEEE